MSEGREVTDYLIDILQCLEEIEEFTTGFDFQTFSSDRKTINAVLRSLEVMGEAAKHIPEAIRQVSPEIPWKSMAGLRDVLIHDYMGVDLRTVWNVVQDRLPGLPPLLKKLIS
ncbi:DUF86 domain-containing protein [Geothermobacter hydrogeniphilus]|uniref:DUF86 domain-containing protein n=1 Tax=Geothermobacter hydrogeniphilus TaxID=1969733 RepID=A0A2K2H8S5_9BACT|nr:DUF86 domain-containing protein [Geothermobacter hydrogeniphilus]PNU19708.1 DUF86 domain-containing protein [Geothermobacter hydrogeniphilus]